MPLPRLQTIKRKPSRVLYDISWKIDVKKSELGSYPESAENSNFDNTIRLLEGVGQQLAELHGILRPLIYSHWADCVARFNRLERDNLVRFLFGDTRLATVRLRTHLWKFQNGKCFYCNRSIETAESAEIDHFIPWSYYPDDNLANLVAAHKDCNSFKSNHLASEHHLEKWLYRLDEPKIEDSRLRSIASETQWDISPRRSLNIASWPYRQLPYNSLVWEKGGNMKVADPDLIAKLFDDANRRFNQY